MDIIAQNNPKEQKQSLLEHIKANLLENKNLSLRGLAEMCGVSKTSIIESGHFRSKKLAELLESYGFQAGHIIENGFDAQATWLIIEYFAYESKAKAIRAKQLARTFGSVGIYTVFEELKKPQELPAESEPQRKVIPLPQERRADIWEKLYKLNEVQPDDRTTLVLKNQGINLLEAGAEAESAITNQPQFLSVTEICEMGGIKVPKGKDNHLGRKVAKAYRQEWGEEPPHCEKQLDNGHRAQPKIYPMSFYDRVVEIAKDYLLAD